MKTGRKNPDNITPKAEARAPRSGMTATDLPALDLSGAVSPLAAYLNTMGISVNAFCKASGLDHKVVKELVEGNNLPSSMTMLYLEIITKGRVAPEMWAGTPLGKARFQKLLERADPEVQRQVSQLPGGGFAAPLKKDPRGRKPEQPNNEE